MADLHPAAEVVGVDLSPIQPNFVPPNCRFEVDDINKEWTFPENKFDFIHIRYMTGTVPDWTELLKKVHRHVYSSHPITYRPLSNSISGTSSLVGGLSM